MKPSDRFLADKKALAMTVLNFRAMASDIRAQMGKQFLQARDDYIAAIKAHADALTAYMETNAVEIRQEYERATTALKQKQEAYRRATDNLRDLSSER